MFFQVQGLDRTMQEICAGPKMVFHIVLEVIANLHYFKNLIKNLYVFHSLIFKEQDDSLVNEPPPPAREDLSAVVCSLYKAIL